MDGARGHQATSERAADDAEATQVAAELIAAMSDDVAATLRSRPGTTIVSTLSRAARAEVAVDERITGEMLRGLTGAVDGAPVLRLGATIGEGGMGVIRLGEQVSLGRTVAIKTLKPDRRDPASALDLMREAWVTGALEHPNIVPVHHLGVDDDGSPVIVLKRIEGVSWDELVADAETVAARFDAADLLAWNLGILVQVLNAVRFAHSRGVIHRDLKPANVMIGEYGEVYLLDWGLAVSLRPDGSGRLPLAAHATAMAGTPAYMAPEMLGRDESPPLSEQTDVYLAGAILYELIAGAPPHEVGDAVAVITSVIRSSPEVPAAAPAELARICLRAMAADPDARHPSAEVLQQELREHLDRRGATRLVELAIQRLDELRAVIGGADVELGARRDQVYRLFGACRFGFHEALAVWREHPQARSGLEAAITAIAEYELAVGEPRAALHLLGELGLPPPALMARVRAAAEEERRRLAALERFRRRHDYRTGARTRTFVVALLGLVFTATPLIAWLGPGHLGARSHGDLIATTLVLLAAVVGLGWWGRESMMKTTINLRAFGSGVFLFVIQVLLLAGFEQLGIGLVQTQIVLIGVWLIVTGMMAIGIDFRLAPGAAGYAMGFAIASARPDWRYAVMAICNGAFAVNAVLCWRSDRWAGRAADRPPRA